MITAKEIFTTKLHGVPIKLEYLTSAHRAEWPATIELFYEHKVFKKLDNGAEVLYEVQILVPDLSNPTGRKLMVLEVGQSLLEHTAHVKTYE